MAPYFCSYSYNRLASVSYQCPFLKKKFETSFGLLWVSAKHVTVILTSKLLEPRCGYPCSSGLSSFLTQFWTVKPNCLALLASNLVVTTDRIDYGFFRGSTRCFQESARAGGVCRLDHGPFPFRSFAVQVILSSKCTGLLTVAH